MMNLKLIIKSCFYLVIIFNVSYLIPIPVRNPSSSYVALYGIAVATAVPSFSLCSPFLSLILCHAANRSLDNPTANPDMSTGKDLCGRRWPTKPTTRF